MNNGEAWEAERHRKRVVVLRVGLVVVVMVLFFVLLLSNNPALDPQSASSLSSSTTSITNGNSNNEVLLATLTPLQAALFLDRLNNLITVNSVTTNTRDLTQGFPRNISGLFQGTWDDTSTATGKAAGTGGGGDPPKFPWNVARHGDSMVCQNLTLINSCPNSCSKNNLTYTFFDR